MFFLPSMKICKPLFNANARKIKKERKVTLLPILLFLKSSINQVPLLQLSYAKVAAKHFQFGVNFPVQWPRVQLLFVFLDKIFAQFIEHLMHKSQPWG